jgi:hypothetical protein
MKKADHKFYRDKREQIDRLSRQNESFWYCSHKPIFIPKRGKKK